MYRLSRAEKLSSAIKVMVGGNVVAVGLMAYTGNETMYRNLIMPLARLLDPETAHRWAVRAAKYGFVPNIKQPDLPELTTSVFGLQFSTPIGLAAGFDKHGEAIDGMSKLGFGFVEVGSITPLPQEGNPKPRLFRLREDSAVINRYGFNSDGHEMVYERLKDRQKGKRGRPVPDDRNMLNENFWSPAHPRVRGQSRPERCVVGVNLGKNKMSPDGVGDYVVGVQRFGELSDYLVINVSSPNTPGLRDMQGREQLQKLVDKVRAERDRLPGKRPPLLVKVAPDLTDQDKVDIAAVVGDRNSGVDGLIVSNTTVSRPESLKSQHKTEAGGLSGTPLRDLSTATVRDFYRLTHGRVPIIGVGGVGSGRDAYEKIRAGASLVQIYSALTYQGPPLVARIKRELADILRKDGFSNVSEAVGADFKNHKSTDS